MVNRFLSTVSNRRFAGKSLVACIRILIVKFIVDEMVLSVRFVCCSLWLRDRFHLKLSTKVKGHFNY